MYNTKTKNNNECFERAFSGAIVHDIFNVLSVAILLPIEYAFGYLERVTSLLVRPLAKYSTQGSAQIEFLSALTKPLTHLIIQLDDSALDEMASGHSNSTSSMIKKTCEGKVLPEPCQFLFASTNLAEWAVGLILILSSLTGLCISLVLLVKLLNSIFFGHMASIIKKFINADFPGVFKFLTGYVFIIVDIFKNSYKNCKASIIHLLSFTWYLDFSLSIFFIFI